MKVYTLRDIKVATYLPPFLAENHAVAKRLLGDSQREESIIYQHPEDFEVFQIAEFNRDSGVITPLMQHESLGLVSELLPHPMVDQT